MFRDLHAILSAMLCKIESAVRYPYHHFGRVHFRAESRDANAHSKCSERLRFPVRETHTQDAPADSFGDGDCFFERCLREQYAELFASVARSNVRRAKC